MRIVIITATTYLHVKSRLTTLQNQFLDSVISPSDYQTMKQRVEKDLIGLELKLKGLKEDKSSFKKYVNQTVSMLENIVEYYRKSDGMTKKKILGCNFSEKLVFEKGRVATTPFTEPIQVLFKIARVLQGSENKKEVENNLLSTLAPQTAESCNRVIQYNL